MLLATGSATDKAEAAKIVGSLRNVKAAVVTYYADNGSYPTQATYIFNDPTASPTNDTIKSLDVYLDNTPGSKYRVIVSSTGKVSVAYTGVIVGSGVEKRLSNMAADAALFNNENCSEYYSSGTTVYMSAKK